MVEPLSNAQELMNMILKASNEKHDIPLDIAIAQAQAYAAIAQAEQLKRIADALHDPEGWSIGRLFEYYIRNRV